MEFDFLAGAARPASSGYHSARDVPLRGGVPADHRQVTHPNPPSASVQVGCFEESAQSVSSATSPANAVSSVGSKLRHHSPGRTATSDMPQGRAAYERKA